jgi:ubiquinone/menaquinone biosynthesis C-methylase UbiE
VDCDAESVAAASQKSSLNNLIYKAGEATAIPAKDREFDVVVSFETIEHLPEVDQDKFVSELARVISDDGLVFVSTPNLVISWNKNPYHIKELSLSEFKEVLKKYFPFVVILEQGNGIVSFVKPSGDQKIKSAEITSSSEPLYFVAICSRREITEDGYKGEGMGSVSVKALNRMKNNPIIKVSNKIYPLIKFFFKK